VIALAYCQIILLDKMGYAHFVRQRNYLCMHTKDVNGIPNKTMDLEWVVTSTLWDFEVMKKRWGYYCSL